MYTLGDALIRIKNAYLAKKKEVILPSSSFVGEVLKILLKEGFLSGVEQTEKERKIKAVLKYQNRQPVLTEIRLFSKPGARRYLDVSALGKLGRRSRGLVILSTPAGLSTLPEAKKNKKGGELLCEVY